MNKGYIYKLTLISFLSLLLLHTLYNLSNLETVREISNHYIHNGVAETGSINLVTSILFDYRGFDTLGEATVILAAAASLAFLVPKRKVTMLSTKFTVIVYQTILLIAPFLGILGIYLILFGHLSPGGGFTGGVVLATTLIVLTITYGVSFTEKRFRHHYLSFTESLGAFLFVILGITGIIAGANFLTNIQAGFSPGFPGKIISGGIIPFLNLAVGFKVGAGLIIIFNSLIKED